MEGYWRENRRRWNAFKVSLFDKRRSCQSQFHVTRRREALSAQPASTLTAGGTFTAAGGGNGPRSDRNSRPHLRKTPEHILRTNYVAGTKIESDLGKIKQEKKSGCLKSTRESRLWKTGSWTSSRLQCQNRSDPKIIPLKSSVLHPSFSQHDRSLSLPRVCWNYVLVSRL